MIDVTAVCVRLSTLFTVRFVNRGKLCMKTLYVLAFVTGLFDLGRSASLHWSFLNPAWKSAQPSQAKPKHHTNTLTNRMLCCFLFMATQDNIERSDRRTAASLHIWREHEVNLSGIVEMSPQWSWQVPCASPHDDYIPEDKCFDGQIPQYWEKYQGFRVPQGSAGISIGTGTTPSKTSMPSGSSRFSLGLEIGSRTPHSQFLQLSFGSFVVLSFTSFPLLIVSW